MEASRESQDNSDSNKEPKQEMKKKELGGIKTMPFILATEVCDRFATVGFHANMISYLTQELNMPLVRASNVITNLDGTASLTPLLGALVADSFAGRYWTIFVASIIYELGLVSITTTALLKSLQPPPCPTQVNCIEASASQMGVLYLSLLLIAAGLGGIRPCVVSFAADQLDMRRSSVASRSWNFFNWYYLCMAVAKLGALTIVVYIQDNVGWGWGLGIPTVALFFSFVAFVCGSPLYKRQKPGGSPLIRLLQVIVAALRKRKEVVPEDPALLYHNKELDKAISVHGRLLHTNDLKWIDKAAIVKEADHHQELTHSKDPPNLWKLASVHRVEELKSFIRLLPVWSAGILYVTANSHQHTFTIQQARTMDRHLISPSFQVPPASLSIFNNLTLILGLILYERLLVPFAKKLSGNPLGITNLQRMGVGMFFNIFSTMVSALVEVKRKSTAADHHLLDKPTAMIPISVFWLVPQFFFHGVAELFLAVGQLEFFYDQSPESMRSIAIAMVWIANAAGNYLGTFMVSLVHQFSGERHNWLPDRNLNIGKLDYYYWLVTILQVVNLGYFFLCAWFYTSKPLDEAREEVDNDDHVRNSVELQELSVIFWVFRIPAQSSDRYNPQRPLVQNRNAVQRPLVRPATAGSAENFLIRN